MPVSEKERLAAEVAKRYSAFDAEAVEGGWLAPKFPKTPHIGHHPQGSGSGKHIRSRALYNQVPRAPPLAGCSGRRKPFPYGADPTIMGGPKTEYTGTVVKAPELKRSARIEILPLAL
jgi:hypothetical protein